MKATVRCPYCNTQGLKNLALKKLGAFNLIYCGTCGAIHGVIPSISPRQASEEAGEQKQTDVNAQPPKEKGEPALTPARAELMARFQTGQGTRYRRFPLQK